MQSPKRSALMRSPLTTFLFNKSQLQAGQSVAVRRVVLQHWGFNGTVTGVSATNVRTGFRQGFASTGSLAVGDKVRVVGLLFKDPSTGNTVLVGRYVDNMAPKN